LQSCIEHASKGHKNSKKVKQSAILLRRTIGSVMSLAMKTTLLLLSLLTLGTTLFTGCPVASQESNKSSSYKIRVHKSGTPLQNIDVILNFHTECQMTEGTPTTGAGLATNGGKFSTLDKNGEAEQSCNTGFPQANFACDGGHIVRFITVFIGDGKLDFCGRIVRENAEITVVVDTDSNHPYADAATYNAGSALSCTHEYFF